MTVHRVSIPTSIDLADLAKGTPGITPAYGSVLAEAATICLESRAHPNGVTMGVDGDFGGKVNVRWAPLADQVQASKCWNDPEYTTEHGAYGVASLLVSALTDLTVVARSRKRTGFDFWLGRKDDADPLFQNKARLEVSGMGEGSETEIRARVGRKLKQTQQSDAMGIPALVAVVEFGSPRSRMVKR